MDNGERLKGTREEGVQGEESDTFKNSVENGQRWVQVLRVGVQGEESELVFEGVSAKIQKPYLL